MRMTRKLFIVEVIDEINNIKKRATSEEISKLDLETFDHANRYACIYGQMTGSCTSVRAKDLMAKTYSDVCQSLTFTDFVKFSEQKFKNDGETYYTPLEKYLYMVVVKNRANIFYSIITYLKGESDELIKL